MLSPSWQRLPVWNLLHLLSYSIHVLLILYPVLLLAGGFRPQVHRIRWVLAFLCATATPIFFLNRMLKTNFFFLNDPQGNNICHGSGQSGINGCSVQEFKLRFE